MSPSITTTPAAARPGDLREHNLATILQEVLASDPPASRADIAARVGLTRSTVSRLVDELTTAGLLREHEAAGTGLRGRPAVPLTADCSTLISLGLEINVGRRAVRAIDLSGTVLASRLERGNFRGCDPASALTSLAAMTRQTLAELPGRQLAGVAVAVPGLVDSRTGTLLRAPNLGWEQIDIAGSLTTALDIRPPVVVQVSNEADHGAFTVARRAPGRPSGMSDFLYISGEEGIGSAVVLNGQLMTGRHGWTGEIGHVTIDPTGLECACGSRGCLEVVAGTRALCDAAGVPDIPALTTAAASGERAAMVTLERAASTLGIAVAAALNLLDVPLVVLGGHLAPVARWLIPGLEAELSQRVLAFDLAPTQIIAARLDEAPAATGAAFCGFDNVLQHPSWWFRN